MGRVPILADAGQENVETDKHAAKYIQRNTFEGLGEPEPLKDNLAGWWSRRIDVVNRIVYREKDGVIVIAQCKGNYDD